METLCRLNRFALGYLFAHADDVSDEELYRGQDSANSPGWCLGHLAVEGDHACMQLGLERRTPAAWDGVFLMDARWNKSGLPQKQELLDAVRDVYEALRTQSLLLTPAERAGPCPSDFLKRYLPTLELWIGHMLTTHVTMHAGNLVTWLRLRG